MADTGLSTAQRQLAHGSKYPYDGGSEAAPAIDWAHVAARGVMADLLDRRGVKWELEKVDLDVRADIVTAVAAIVRAALASRPAEVGDSPTPPKTPEQIVAFIGNHYDSMEDLDDVPDIRFTLSVHDLMSAMYEWFEHYEIEAAPSHTTNKEK